jgi:hypothetical protein
VKTVFLSLPQYVPGKIPAQCGLPARERNAAAGKLIEELVGQDLVHDLLHSHAAAFEFKCAREAGGNALATELAPFPDEGVDAVVKFVGVIRTGGDAAATGNATIRVVAKFRCGMLALGVVAPEALHGAAFEEYGCADPRAIMKGEPLNVENNVTRSHGAAVLAVSAYAVEAFDGGGLSLCVG